MISSLMLMSLSFIYLSDVSIYEALIWSSFFYANKFSENIFTFSVRYDGNLRVIFCPFCLFLFANFIFSFFSNGKPCSWGLFCRNLSFNSCSVSNASFIRPSLSSTKSMKLKISFSRLRQDLYVFPLYIFAWCFGKLS